MSSLILVLRTRAVWHRSKSVTILLGLLFVGQIAVWSQSQNFGSCPSWALTHCSIYSIPLLESEVELNKEPM